MENQEQQKPLSAGQRLENLEKSVTALEETAKVLDGALYNMANSVNRLADEHSNLQKKVLALVTILESGGAINAQAVEDQTVNHKAMELKNALEEKLATGELVVSEVVNDGSFLAGREVNSKTNAVVNPRAQFAMFVLDEDMKARLQGKRVGDIVSVDEDTNLEIEEVYQIQEERLLELTGQQQVQA